MSWDADETEDGYFVAVVIIGDGIDEIIWKALLLLLIGS